MNLLLAAAFTLILDGQEYQLEVESIDYIAGEYTLIVDTKDQFLSCIFNRFFWDKFESKTRTDNNVTDEK